MYVYWPSFFPFHFSLFLPQFNSFLFSLLSSCLSSVILISFSFDPLLWTLPRDFFFFFFISAVVLSSVSVLSLVNYCCFFPPSLPDFFPPLLFLLPFLLFIFVHLWALVWAYLIQLRVFVKVFFSSFFFLKGGQFLSAEVFCFYFLCLYSIFV